MILLLELVMKALYVFMISSLELEQESTKQPGFVEFEANLSASALFSLERKTTNQLCRTMYLFLFVKGNKIAIFQTPFQVAT